MIFFSAICSCRHFVSVYLIIFVVKLVASYISQCFFFFSPPTQSKVSPDCSAFNLLLGDNYKNSRSIKVKLTVATNCSPKAFYEWNDGQQAQVYSLFSSDPSPGRVLGSDCGPSIRLGSDGWLIGQPEQRNIYQWLLFFILRGRASFLNIQ